MNKPNCTPSLKVKQEERANEKTPTPPSITGVVTTRTGRCKITVDYIKATFPNNEDVRRMIRGTFEPGKTQKTTIYGYEYRATVLEHGCILWSESNKRLGIHIDLPAKALAHWQRPIDWLLEIVLSNGGKLGRIDLALDDNEGLLKMDQMLTAFQVGDVVCRARVFKSHYEAMAIGSGPARLTGISVGSRESESYMRIYDKRIEQTKSDGSYNGPENWVRVELELTGKRSNAACKMMIDAIRAGNGERWVVGLIYGFLDFKERNDQDSNKTRWETAVWWDAFLGNVAKQRICLPDKIQTIEHVKTWFENSVSPMAAVLLLQENMDGMTGYDWLMSVIAAGESRFQAKHKRLAGVQLEIGQQI